MKFEMNATPLIDVLLVLLIIFYGDRSRHSQRGNGPGSAGVEVREEAIVLKVLRGNTSQWHINGLREVLRHAH